MLAVIWGCYLAGRDAPAIEGLVRSVIARAGWPRDSRERQLAKVLASLGDPGVHQFAAQLGQAWFVFTSLKRRIERAP